MQDKTSEIKLAKNTANIIFHINVAQFYFFHYIKKIK